MQAAAVRSSATGSDALAAKDEGPDKSRPTVGSQRRRFERYAKTLTHLTTPEISGFNALCDAQYVRISVKGFRAEIDKSEPKFDASQTARCCLRTRFLIRCVAD
jgi:hypothetical protein